MTSLIKRFVIQKKKYFTLMYMPVPISFINIQIKRHFNSLDLTHLHEKYTK